MNPEVVEGWLKNTIPGIILLGAFGSIAAVVMLKSLRYLVARLARRWERVFRRLDFLIGYRHGFFVGIVEAREDPLRLMVYLAFHLACVVLYASMLTALAVSLGVAFSRQIDVRLSAVTYGLSFGSGLVASLCLHHFLLLRKAYGLYVTPVFRRADEVYRRKHEPNRVAGSD